MVGTTSHAEEEQLISKTASLERYHAHADGAIDIDEYCIIR
jgi:hypothetical protein